MTFLNLLPPTATSRYGCLLTQRTLLSEQTMYSVGRSGAVISKYRLNATSISAPTQYCRPNNSPIKRLRPAALPCWYSRTAYCSMPSTDIA